MKPHRKVKADLFLSGLIFFLLTSSAVSQSKNYEGVRHPKNFKIQEHKPALAKQMSDTFHYNTFTKIKQDFAVNSGCGLYGSDQHQINIASDPRGGFLCAWNDDRIGDRQVNAQLFDINGNRIGTVIHVSEGDANWNSEPHITFNRTTNEYIVLWAGSGYDIRFQRITALGEMVGHNLTATQVYSTNTNNPSAATDSAGNIIVTWTADVTCCMTEIPYCRIFDKAGIPITDQWSITGSGNANISSSGWDDRIAADSSGRCIIVWSSFIDGRSRIVLQSVNRAGNVYAQPIIVSDPADSSDHIFPSVTSTKDGHFLILWGSNFGMDGRIFLADSGFVTPQFTVSYLQNYWTTGGSSSDDQNKFFVSWFSDRPYGQIISTQGQFSGAAKPLSFSSSVTWWSYPKLSKGLFDRLFLVYGGYDRTQQDVMLQAFDASFNPIGSSVKAADDGCSAWQTNPTVKYNRFGKSLVTWEDQRNGDHQLYGQVLDESGNPVSTNIRISDPDTILWVSAPSIVADSGGNFLVSFGGGDYSSRNLILQKVSAEGTLIGSNKWITTDCYDDNGGLINVLEKNNAGDLLLCWYVSPYAPLYVQRLSPDLSAHQAPSPVLTAAYVSSKYLLGVSTNSQFNILVMWTDYNYQSYTMGKSIKAMIVNEQGKIVRDTVIVATIGDQRSFNKCACQIDDNNNMLFVWSEFDTYGEDVRMNVKRVYAGSDPLRTDSFPIDNVNARIQIIKFDNRKAFVAWDAYYMVYSIFFDDILSTYTAVKLHEFNSFINSLGEMHNAYHADVFGNNLLFGYESSQNADMGYDIYANIQRIDQFNFQYVSSSTENTESVYPNPSSRTATLQYEITQPTRVSIAVYNILGQKIADVENGIKSPGIYTAQFQTTGLAAGVYFFSYHGIKSYSKKFIVIK